LNRSEQYLKEQLRKVGIMAQDHWLNIGIGNFMLRQLHITQQIPFGLYPCSSGDCFIQSQRRMCWGHCT